MYEEEIIVLEQTEFEAYEIFSRLGTQWKVAGMTGVATGLDYSSIPMFFDLLSVKNREHCLSCIQIMERHALAVMAEFREE